MIKKILQLFRRRRPAKQELYIDQPVLARYGDFKTIGQWGVLREDGTVEDGGRMMSETVKFLGYDGGIKIGKDWVAEKSRNA